MEKKLQKPYPTDFNLFIEQDVWQAYHQILLMIFLKKFIKLNELILIFDLNDLFEETRKVK